MSFDSPTTFSRIWRASSALPRATRVDAFPTCAFRLTTSYWGRPEVFAMNVSYALITAPSAAASPERLATCSSIQITLKSASSCRSSDRPSIDLSAANSAFASATLSRPRRTRARASIALGT